MQNKSKPLDDLTNLFTNAVGAVKGVGDEVKAMGRSRAEQMVADLDLVTRDEFEVFKALVQNLQMENADLKARIEKLEKAGKKKR